MEIKFLTDERDEDPGKEHVHWWLMGQVTKCDMSAIILPSASRRGQGWGWWVPTQCPLWGRTLVADLSLPPLPSDDGYTPAQYGGCVLPTKYATDTTLGWCTIIG